jgi:thymidylate synthase (FAD)
MHHQKVRLIAVTKPIASEFRDHADANDLITYCARVSNPENQENFDTGEKLLRYCVRKKHWSIFEMADLILEIETTRDIGRQILRHQSFKFQEFSQRYADPTVMPMVFRETRLQDPVNRQNSIDTDKWSLIRDWEYEQAKVRDTALAAYKWAIANGIAKEQARAVLPEGMTMSRMYMKGNVRDWFHYWAVRHGEETQKEHRDIANKLYPVLCEQFPFIKEIELD